MAWTLEEGSERNRPACGPRFRLRTTMLRVALLAAALGRPAAAGDALRGAAEITVVEGVTTLRRIPEAGLGSGGDAAPLRNGHFSEGLDAWSSGESGGSAAPGGVLAEDGEAVLREGDSFLVTLSQTVLVEPGATTLSFTVRLVPGFDLADASIPDAFEASLLAGDLGSVVPTWSGDATSFLNFQESGTVLAGPGVAWDGERASVDLSAVPDGESVTLYFDLIGADGDSGSAVRVDDVRVTTRAEEGFIRGNANLDDALDITDPIVILNYLFLGTSDLNCLDAADVDDDGRVNITDPIYLLGYLFLGNPPPPPPFPTCGPDEGEDDGLGCGPCSCPASAGGDCP